MGIAIPQEFIWRRVHSLMGFWLVLFLTEHLLTNSQAALLLGDNARGFINMVNALHNLPYLEAIEVFLLGFPLLIHMAWGIKYALAAKSNSKSSDGSRPSLKYGRNRAYSWQRITSWVLLIGIIGHVTKFRFLDYPLSLNQGASSSYFVRISMDNGLYTLGSRLGFQIYDAAAVEKEKQELAARKGEEALVEIAKTVPSSSSHDVGVILTGAQKYRQKVDWVGMLGKKTLQPGQVIAVTNQFGTASLLTVRDTFKSPVYVGIYTIFVLAACFHGFNGLWTFLITWGALLRMPAQRWGVKFCTSLMVIVTFLGLAAIWGTYWVNLRT